MHYNALCSFQSHCTDQTQMHCPAMHNIHRKMSPFPIVNIALTKLGADSNCRSRIKDLAILQLMPGWVGAIDLLIPISAVGRRPHPYFWIGLEACDQNQIHSEVQLQFQTNIMGSINGPFEQMIVQNYDDVNLASVVVFRYWP